MHSRQTLEQTAEQLNAAAIHLLRGLRSTDRGSGLTDARLSALSVLVFGGSCTLRALADAEGVTSATMSRVVDGLVDSGLAARDPHPDSARKILVRATDEGTAVMHAARQRRVDVITEALAGLPAEDRAHVVEASAALRALAAGVPVVARRRADVQPLRPSAPEGAPRPEGRHVGVVPPTP